MRHHYPAERFIHRHGLYQRDIPGWYGLRGCSFLLVLVFFELRLFSGIPDVGIAYIQGVTLSYALGRFSHTGSNRTFRLQHSGLFSVWTTFADGLSWNIKARANLL